MNLSYNTTVDSAGRILYCFTTPNGLESPTLHVHPGDTLTVSVKRQSPGARLGWRDGAGITNASTVCGAAIQDASSVNIHTIMGRTPPRPATPTK